MAKVSDSVNSGVLDDETRVWKWPFVHVWDQTLIELQEVVLGDRILGDLKLKNIIEGYGEGKTRTGVCVHRVTIKHGASWS
jgi:hypothetical protein